MTCVIALKTGDGRVLMGADSAGGAGTSHWNRVDPKIYRVGGMLIGFTTSFRMGQLLGYKLAIPEHHPDVPVERYMATLFVDAVRACLKDGGYAKKENESEKGGTFLAAYRSRIFEVSDDYQVGERADDFNAVGCGFEIALGALYTSRSYTNNARKRVEDALEAAAQFSSAVRAPFIIQELSAYATT